MKKEKILKFISTRDASRRVSAATAIVEGIAPDGGLYVPESFPGVSLKEIESLCALDYPARAAYIIGKYLTDYDAGALDRFVRAAYGRFDGDAAPLVKVDEGLYMLELWHGPTHAFKDIALTLLPYLLTEGKRITGIDTRTLILVATSGDTGKAALEGFKDVDGTDIIVLYPNEGVSAMQKRQMATQAGGNVAVTAINGNFDNAQAAVKRVFADKQVNDKLRAAGYALSSANSINFGRLVPQIAYYFSAYADLLDEQQIKLGDPVNFCVPSGNFGNILAGYYAKRMGLPVGRLICASNRNNMLTDYFETGEYRTDRPFFKTTSPSMDILDPSNLERLDFELTGRDAEATAGHRRAVTKSGGYVLTETERARLNEFDAGWVDEETVQDTIGGFFDEYGYVLDPHTAVAVGVYSEGEYPDPTVIVSTASPHKFPAAVLSALDVKPGGDEFKAMSTLEDETGLPVPESLASLKSQAVRFSGCIDPGDAEAFVLQYVKR